MKLTVEYWNVIGGWLGGAPAFCGMFEKGLKVCREHREEIALVVEQGVKVTSSDLGFVASERAAKLAGDGVRRRLEDKGSRREERVFVRDLVDFAMNDWSTSTYDYLQKTLNGYTI